MTSTPSSKRRCITELRVGGITDTALAKLIKLLKDEPDALHTNRKEIGAALLAIGRQCGSYATMKLQSSGTFEWFFGDVEKTLNYFISHCPSFAKVMMTRLELKPNSHTVPWNFLLYTDELTPGAVLKPSNMRKSWAFYFSFRELGRRHLASQHCWLPLGVLRSSVPIRGGISAAVATMLARSFTEQNTNMLDHGISLADLYNEPRLFFARLGNILADDDANTKIWSSMGAGATLCCQQCKNVLSAYQSHRVALSEYFVDITCSDVKRFDVCTSEEHWQKIDALAELAQQPRSSKKLAQKQTSLGTKHEPFGLMSVKALRRFVRPADAITHDAMHVGFCNGIMHNEIHNALTSLRMKLNIDYSHVCIFSVLIGSGRITANRSGELHTRFSLLRELLPTRNPTPSRRWHPKSCKFTRC